MVEKIIEKVINQMIPHLDQRQLEYLSNVLYVNLNYKKFPLHLDNQQGKCYPNK